MHSRLKRCLVGVSTAAMVFGTVATGATVSAASQGSAAFSDVAGNKDLAAITFLAQLGVVNGVGNGLFDPSAPVTREQFAKIVVNLMGKGNVAAALQNVTPTFTDASSIDSWAWGYVNAAADMGIIKGYPDGSFQPNAPVSDVEAAAMLIRAIGDDEPGIVTGTWPGNYVAAAYALGITDSNVTFVSNLPASRADIAELAFNAAITAKTAVAMTTGTTTTWQATGSPLYDANAINDYQAYNGTVTGISNSSISLDVWGGSKNWADNYQVVAGASSVNLNGLLGIPVTVVVNTSSGDVVFVTLQSGKSATPNTGSLADSNTAVPSGYYHFSNNGADWLVTNDYNCSTQQPGGSSCTADGANYYVLLGGSTPTAVQLESYDNTSTKWIINAASTGLNTDNAASVPDYTYLNNSANAADTNASSADDDTVSYILDSNNKISSLYDTHVSIPAALIVKTLCPSGCDDTPANAGSQQNQVEVQWVTNGTTENAWVNLQSWTTLTLNGATGTLSKSLDNDVAYVSLVGNGDAWTFSGSTGTPMDENATTIAVYDNTVTGTITGYTSTSGTPSVSTITIQPSNGSAQTLSTDSGFNSPLQVGTIVTLALDSAGKVRAVISTNASSNAAVALVTATGSSTTLGGGTTYTLAVNESAGNAESVNVYPNNGGQSSYTGTVYSTTYYQGDMSNANDNDGLIVYQTNAEGYAVTPAASPATSATASGAAVEAMTAVTPGTLFPLVNTNKVTGDYLQVYSNTSSSVVLALYNSAGNLDYTNSNGNPFYSVSNGGAFKESDGSWLGFGGLDTGKTIGVWEAQVQTSSGPVLYFAIVSNQ